MTISSKTKLRFAVITAVIAIVASIFITSQSPKTTTAHAAEEYSYVLDDLKKDSTFSVYDYPSTAAGNTWHDTCSVIAVAESVKKELFIYIYNSCGAYHSELSSAFTVNDVLNTYPLKMVSGGANITKYLVQNFTVSDESIREYNLTSLYLNSVGWTINKTWTMTTDGNKVTCSVSSGKTFNLGIIGQDLSGVSEVHSAVLSDLKKASNFDETKYKKISEIHLEIVTLAESEDLELYVYCYHSAGVDVTQLRAQELYISFSDANGQSYKYRLSFVNYNNVFAKYKVEKYKVKTDDKRIYNIVSVVDAMPRTYEIGRVWTFRDQADGTTDLTVSSGEAYYIGKLASCYVSGGGDNPDGGESGSESNNPKPSESGDKNNGGTTSGTNSKGKIVAAAFGTVGLIAIVAAVISYFGKGKKNAAKSKITSKKIFGKEKFNFDSSESRVKYSKR